MRAMADDPAGTFRYHVDREEIDAQDPAFLLAEGEHLGFRWVVAHNGLGHRCGYVRIPPGHPWHGLKPADIPARAHGGLNWAEPAPSGSYWIGFDAMHAYDLPDPDLRLDGPGMAALNARTTAIYARYPEYDRRAAIRGRAYMEDQCRRLCEQAAAAGGGAA